MDETAANSRKDLNWTKSVVSGAQGNCVEVADLPGGSVGIRHSASPFQGVLEFTPAEFAAFRQGVKNGEFDGFGNS